MFLWSLCGDITHFWFLFKPPFLLTVLVSSKPQRALSFVAVTYINSESQPLQALENSCAFASLRNGSFGRFCLGCFEAERCVRRGEGWIVIDTSLKPVLWPNYPVKHSKILPTNHKLYACYSVWRLLVLLNFALWLFFFFLNPKSKQWKQRYFIRLKRFCLEKILRINRKVEYRILQC